MADFKEIVKLAVDAHKGSVQKYSVAESQEVMRQALIEANNGKTTLDYRDIRDGKCNRLFTLIETIIPNIVYEGLTGTEFFMDLVESRNLALGDSETFLVEDIDLYTIAEVADGTQGIRRQRLSGVTEVTIPTTLKAVRIYEEMSRVLSGRVDFNAMIDKVAESYQQALLNDIYSLWIGATSTEFGETYFPAAGAYDEDTLLDLIAHVEAAAGGKTATIIGTKKAVRNLQASVLADSAKEDLYNLGYYGKFFGSPVIVIPQRHKIGTTDFIYDDNILTIIAGDDKPLKFISEGDSLVLTKDPVNNADFTQELIYATAA